MNNTVSIRGAARLSHWGLIRARGADTAKFLHSQLTNDFLTLGLSEARLAGFCSAKGRLLASFVAWKLGHDDVLLACHRSVLPSTLKRLSMFVMRAQCKLTDASDEFQLFGLAGQPAEVAVNGVATWRKADSDDGAVVIRLPDASPPSAAPCVRALWVVSAGMSPPADAPEIPLDTWRWLELHSGVPTIEAATVEQFVPQMINFELLSGVNFQKGCYPGQEVVARSQYRGTIKRRMFLMAMDAPAEAGQEVFQGQDADQPAGLVVNAAPNPFNASNAALVELKLAAFAEGDLHLGSSTGPRLMPGTLPYDIPHEAAG